MMIRPVQLSDATAIRAIYQPYADRDSHYL